MDDSNVSIIIPSFNEEKKISSTLQSIRSYFKNSEIILVSDGSTDNTVKIAKKAEDLNLKVIELKKRHGKGYAVITGLKASSKKIIGFIDADDAFEMKKIKEMILLIKEDQADCVIASKWKGKKFFEVKESFVRKLMSRIWNVLARFLFGLYFYDTQAGAKFLKRSVFENIEKIISSGFEFDVELLWRIKRKGYKIVEIYVPYKTRNESKFRLYHSLKMPFSILKLRFKL